MGSMLEMRKKVGRKPKFTKEQAMEIMELNLKGYTMESIGKLHNTDSGVVCRTIKKLRSGGYDK